MCTDSIYKTKSIDTLVDVSINHVIKDIKWLIQIKHKMNRQQVLFYPAIT